MREICFCGRSGEIEDREPVFLKDSETGFRCPDCGHTDPVAWLSGEVRAEIFVEAAERHARRKSPTAA